MQVVSRRTPLWPVVGLAVVVGLAGCSRKDEAETADSASAVAAAKAPPVTCHPKLQVMLDALPDSAVNGVAPAFRECKSGAVTASFGDGSRPGETFSYVLSTFRYEDSDLEPLGATDGQQLLDGLRTAVEVVLQSQHDTLSMARQTASPDVDALTPEQRATLPQETRLPSGDPAMVFSEDGRRWRLLSFVGPNRALDISWEDSRKEVVKTDEAVSALLPLAAQVKYELLSN